MSDTNDDDETSVLENVDTEELLEGTKLEDAVNDDDKNLGEAIGRAIGAIIGRQIGELIGRMVTERLSRSDDEEENDSYELSVTVDDETGGTGTVSGATVTAKDADGGLLSGLLGSAERAETDDEGGVTFELTEGEYTIEVDADEGSGEDSVTLEEDEEISLTIEGEDESEESDESEDEETDEDEADEEDEEDEEDEGEESEDEDEE